VEELADEIGKGKLFVSGGGDGFSENLRIIAKGDLGSDFLFAGTGQKDAPISSPEVAGVSHR
jgi:hypothetical protein